MEEIGLYTTAQSDEIDRIKVTKTYSITVLHDRMIGQLSKWLGMDKSEVVKTAIARLYANELDNGHES
jgi:hypothetical protein